MKRFYLLSGLLGLALASIQVRGQSLSDTINLNGIEIQGERILNHTTVKIDKNVIERSSLPDIGTLLRNVAGVNGIRKGGTSVDPSIRGFRFSQLSVMADDGLKVEGGCPNRMDPVASHIETDDVESIIVIKGPYSLKYGPSFGGIIQLNTYKPKSYETFQVHGKLHTSLNANPAGGGQYALLNGGGKKLYFGISGSYKNYGDYTDGNGKAVSSSFTKYNYSAGLGFKPALNQEIVVSFNRNYGRDLKFPALPMDEIKDNTSLFSVDYHIKEPGKIMKKLDFKVYYSGVYHEMDNSFRPAYSIVTPPYTGLMQAVAKVDASNTGGRAELNFAAGKHELNTGLDVELARKDGGRVNTMIMNMNEIETISKKNSNLWKKAQTVNTGLFAEYSYRLKRYQINASARLDYNHALSEDTLKLIKNETPYFDDTQSQYINFSANAGITLSLAGGHSISLYLGRGMRSPDLTERYIKFFLVGYDNYDYLGNPQLRPETNYQSDLILDLNLRKAGKLQLDLFASLVQDYISGVILPPSVAMPKSMGAVGVKQYMNTGKARFYGFESTYTSPVYKGIYLGFTASYTYGIKDTITRNLFENSAVTGQEHLKNDAVQEIPPFEARLNLNYRFYQSKMMFTLESRFVAAQNHVSLAYYEKSTPGFILLNSTFEYAINKTFGIMAGVQNIFDTAYYEHLNRRIVGSANPLYEAGRSIYMNLTVNL